MNAEGLKQLYTLGEIAAVLASVETADDPEPMQNAVTGLLAESFAVLAKTKPALLSTIGAWSDSDVDEWAEALKTAIKVNGGGEC